MCVFTAAPAVKKAAAAAPAKKAAESSSSEDSSDSEDEATTKAPVKVNSWVVQIRLKADGHPTCFLLICRLFCLASQKVTAVKPAASPAAAAAARKKDTSSSSEESDSEEEPAKPVATGKRLPAWRCRKCYRGGEI